MCKMDENMFFFWQGISSNMLIPSTSKYHHKDITEMLLQCNINTHNEINLFSRKSLLTCLLCIQEFKLLVNVTRLVPHMEKELLTLPEHLCSPSFLSVVLSLNAQLSVQYVVDHMLSVQYVVDHMLSVFCRVM